MTIHKKNRKNTKKFLCNHCWKQFVLKENYDTHVQEHATVQMHACVACPKKFIYRENLTRHYKLHLGNKNFECKFCKRAFSKKLNLALHQIEFHVEHRVTYDNTDSEDEQQGNAEGGQAQQENAEGGGQIQQQMAEGQAYISESSDSEDAGANVQPLFHRPHGLQSYTINRSPHQSYTINRSPHGRFQLSNRGIILARHAMRFGENEHSEDDDEFPDDNESAEDRTFNNPAEQSLDGSTEERSSNDPTEVAAVNNPAEPSLDDSEVRTPHEPTEDQTVSVEATT